MSNKKINDLPKNLSQDDKLNLILKQQASLQEEVSALRKRLSRYFIWIYVGATIKILLIVVPLILAAVYLPPLISDFINSWQNGTGAGNWTQILNSWR